MYNKIQTALLPLLSLLPLLLGACTQKETFYERHTTFAEGATLEAKLEQATHLIPTTQQLAWQDLELTAFIHFGINTFTGKEWGDGSDSPTLFAPTDLDTDQWVQTLSDAGFKMVILTAKHHDGFCLWPTETTSYSVASSPWRKGKGDVVAELAHSCKKFGMKLGLYLSPWDRNHPTYGQGEAYNEVYRAQLKELLTRYGTIDEIWFDGANGEGPNGKVQTYDWPPVFALIDSLQPQAITAIMGRDVRWVGNERGYGRETEWSATVLPPSSHPSAEAIKEALQISETTADLGSRALLERATELFWYPSEVDVSIRPGWFYHPGEDSLVKSLPALAEIYFSSVGMNSGLLLNIPPDTRGRFADPDVERIGEFGRFVEAYQASDAVVHFTPLTLEPGASAEVKVDPTQAFSAVELQEDLTKGQRVEAFSVEALIDGSWYEVAKGTTIGHKRILLLSSPLSTTKLRITVTQARGSTHLKSVAARLVPDTVA